MPKPARRHLIAAAVVVAGIATIVPVSLESAGASTAACGTWCTSPYNQAAGSGEVLTVSGNSVVMATASTTSSTQDWTPEYEGDVTDAAGAGVAAQKLTLLYGDSSVYEFQYAPNGVPSDTCLSDGSSDAEKNDYLPPVYTPTLTVVLAPCGLTAGTLWAVDQNNGGNGVDDLINVGYESAYTYLGSTSNSNFLPLTAPYAEPAVLTVNSSGNVVLAPLSEIGSVVSPMQLWGDYLSPAQAQLKKNARSR
jgi:hypothetical protein